MMCVPQQLVSLLRAGHHNRLPRCSVPCAQLSGWLQSKRMSVDEITALLRLRVLPLWFALCDPEPVIPSLRLSFLICKIRDPWESNNVCARVLYSIKGHSDVNYHLIQPRNEKLTGCFLASLLAYVTMGVCFLSQSIENVLLNVGVIHPHPPACQQLAGCLSYILSRAETSPSVTGSTGHPSFNEDKKKILWVKSLRAPSRERAGAGLRRTLQFRLGFCSRFCLIGINSLT